MWCVGCTESSTRPPADRQAAETQSAPAFLSRSRIGSHQLDPMLLKNPFHGTGPTEAFSLPASFFLRSMIFVVLTIFNGLDPMRRAADGPRVNQVRHSWELILTAARACGRS